MTDMTWQVLHLFCFNVTYGQSRIIWCYWNSLLNILFVNFISPTKCSHVVKIKEFRFSMDKQNQQLVGCFSTNFSSLKQLPTVFFFPKRFHQVSLLVYIMWRRVKMWDDTCFSHKIKNKNEKLIFKSVKNLY